TDDVELADEITAAVRGEGRVPRYGLPFAGDNNLLFDRIDVIAPDVEARWYVPLLPGDPPRRGSARLSIAIDRADSSRTTSLLFAPSESASSVPPDAAWIWTPRAPATS